MRRLLAISFLLGSLAIACAADTNARVVKVLPLYLDLQGHDAVSPSLFDRDAYQFYLREHTNEISTIRFDVLWNASSPKNTKLKLRIELRGAGEHGLPRQAILEKEIAPKIFRSWTSLSMNGSDYKNFGSLIAWRATLWNDDELIAEQKSFLW